MQIQDVQPEDTEELDVLMRHVITTSVPLARAETAFVLKNIQQNLHWAQRNVDSVVHLKYLSATGIVGIVLIKNFWNLCSLFVDPAVQRQGIGRALVEEAIQRSISRNDRGHVKVNAAPNAVQFYQSLGFSAIDGHPRKGTSLPMLLPLST
jgi:GNAT superfamily N-acetyltransferase